MDEVWTVAALCSVVPTPVFNLAAVLRKYQWTARPSITAGMVAWEPQHCKIQGFTDGARFILAAKQDNVHVDAFVNEALEIPLQLIGQMGTVQLVAIQRLDRNVGAAETIVNRLTALGPSGSDRR